jgi:hypothetical protein
MKDITEFVAWDELIGKEARGLNKDVDLGEVKEVGRHYIVTEKGRVDKERFYLPKYLAERYDGNMLFFNVTEGQKNDFKRQSPPTYEEYARYRVSSVPSDIESRIRIAQA